MCIDEMEKNQRKGSSRCLKGAIFILHKKQLKH